MRRAPATAALLIAAAAPAALAAGCGSGDDEPGRTVTLRAGQAVALDGDEYRFDPERVVVEGARGATPVRVELRNTGALAHNARIFRDDEELGGTPTFQGGDPRSATLTLEPGRYRIVCTVGDHEDLGMVGELELRR